MNALEYAIKLDSAQATAAMQRFQITAQNVNIHMGNMGKGAGVASGGMSRWAAAAGVATLATGGLAAGIAAVGAAAVAMGTGLKQAAKFEQTTIAFKTLTGSAETAKKVMEDIGKMAIDTPFQEGQLQGAAKAMLAARVPAEQLKGELLAMGNIASATGADIERLSSVYAQVAGKGKLYAEELQQFVEQGAGELRQAVAQSMGVTTAKLMDLMSEGKVGFSDLQQAIQSLAGAGGKWGEAMGEQSRTTIGLLSSLWDGINKITRLLAQPINDGPIKAWLTTAVQVSTQAAQVIEYTMANSKGGEALKNGLILGAKSGVNAFLDALQRGVESAGTLFQMLQEAASSQMGTIGEDLKQAIIFGAKLGYNELLDLTQRTIAAVFDFFNAGWKEIAKSILDVMAKVWAAVEAGFSGSFSKAKSLAENAFSQIKAPNFQGFDTSKQEKHFDNLIKKAKSAFGEISSFSLKSSRFDDTKEMDFFKGLISGAKAADQANKNIQSITGNPGKPDSGKPAGGKNWATELDSKTDTTKKSASSNSDDDRRKRAQDMAQNRNGIMGEIAMLQALVTGNNAKADAVDRALRIQKYQLAIMRETGASEAKALELAQKKANLEDRLNGKGSHIGGVREKHMMGGEIGPLSKGGPLTKGGGLAGFDRLQEKIWEPTKADKIPDGYGKNRPLPKFMDSLSGRGAVPVGPSVNRALGSGQGRTAENDRATADPSLAMLGKINSNLDRIRTA